VTGWPGSARWRSAVEQRHLQREPGLGHLRVAATAAHYTVTGVALVTLGPWELRVRVTGRDAVTLPFQVTG
jgi:hypothetical protein